MIAKRYEGDWQWVQTLKTCALNAEENRVSSRGFKAVRITWTFCKKRISLVASFVEKHRFIPIDQFYSYSDIIDQITAMVYDYWFNVWFSTLLCICIACVAWSADSDDMWKIQVRIKLRLFIEVNNFSRHGDPLFENATPPRTNGNWLCIVMQYNIEILFIEK